MKLEYLKKWYPQATKTTDNSCDMASHCATCMFRCVADDAWKYDDYTEFCVNPNMKRTQE